MKLILTARLGKQRSRVEVLFDKDFVGMSEDWLDDLMLSLGDAAALYMKNWDARNQK
jgi:hypothetical protein